MHKIVIRSIVYHWLFLFIGISIGFIANSEWAGYKYVLLERSIKNIFFPIRYNQEIENLVKEMGKMRTWVELGCPTDFVVSNERVIGEEFYSAKYEFIDKNGEKHSGNAFHRIKWKTWEYYYKLDEIIDGSGVKKLD